MFPAARFGQSTTSVDRRSPDSTGREEPRTFAPPSTVAEILSESAVRRAAAGTSARDRRVFDMAPQPIVVADAVGNLVAVNPAFLNTFGFTFADVLDPEERMRKMIPDPIERARLGRLWMKGVRIFEATGAQPSPFRARVTCKDHSERTIEIRASLMPNESITILTDIGEALRGETDRVRIIAERDTLLAELGLRSDVLPIALVIADPSDELVTRDWNPAAERIFGYSREEMLGSSPFSTIIPAEGHAFVRQTIGRVISESKTSTVIARNRTKDGRQIWCEWSSTSVRGPDGKPAHIVSTVQDVTERLLAEEQQRLWSSVLEKSSEGIMICDTSRRILLVNAAFERLTGFSAAEAIGQSPAILRSGKQSPAFYVQMWDTLNKTGHWSGEIWNRRKSGELYIEWLSVTAIRDAKGALSHYVGIFTDISERKAIADRLQRLAHYDLLTELPNRSLLLDRLEHLIGKARRESQRAAIMFLDLDRFKEINDSMGHDAGDILLQAVAQRISKCVRSSDTVARMGGDEFIVLLPELESADAAAKIAHDILSAVCVPLTLKQQVLSISASIGICIFPSDGDTAGELLSNADAAMYRAKESGRNRAHFYTPELNQRAMERLQMESALRLAIERQELLLHYQPQIDVETGAVVGVEALVRWDRPGIGLVPPGQFIPLAEERGLIAAIDNWVLREAIRQTTAWDKAGLPKLTIAVNISANDFHTKGFVDSVKRAIGDFGFDATRLELELTEGVAVREVQATVQILRELHQSGVRISLDDFGTGYSSLNYLRQLPIDRTKIDQSFVRELDADGDGALRTVRAIVSLAKSFSMEVIAEGVENDAQLRALRAEKCHQVQGYLFSRPLPHADFAELLRTWRPLS
jgi:diguanylate cyclase (GGDEF)-like protein/PAS domain S-box-containing protein